MAQNTPFAGRDKICRNMEGPAHGPFLSSLGEPGHKFFRLPFLRPLLQAAQRVLSVAEPVGRVSINTLPAGNTRVRDVRHLTVLSANLWHDWPWQRRWPQRLELFARLVEAEGADILMLQEITRTPRFRTDEWLAKRLGMACAYSRANGKEAVGFEEGIGVFSRFPLSSPRLRDLGPTADSFVKRVALGAAVKTPFGPLLAFSAHLGISGRRNAAQLSQLRSWVAEVAGNRLALIGGDFNAHEQSSQIVAAQRAWTDTFRHLHPEAEATTHQLPWPWGWLSRRRRLDYIFLQPNGKRWSVLEASHLDAPDGPHSDHRAVLARLAPEMEGVPVQ